MGYLSDVEGILKLNLPAKKTHRLQSHLTSQYFKQYRLRKCYGAGRNDKEKLESAKYNAKWDIEHMSFKEDPYDENVCIANIGWDAVKFRELEVFMNAIVSFINGPCELTIVGEEYPDFKKVVFDGQGKWKWQKGEVVYRDLKEGEVLR